MRWQIGTVLVTFGVGLPSVGVASCAREGSPPAALIDVPRVSGPVAFSEVVPERVDCPTDMVRIPQGTFILGNDSGPEEERPAHPVALGGFCLDTTEVTLRGWRTCVEAGKCEPPGESTVIHDRENCNWGTKGADDRPVNCVSWMEANEYCAWLGKRLPTEEEWEAAARGTSGRLYPWGNEEPKTQACWNSVSKTCPVGAFPTDISPYGVLGMGGNLRELTSSLWCPYGGNPDSCSPWGQVVSRGGAWSSTSPKHLSTTARDFESRGDRRSSLGFRCAKGPNTGPARVFSKEALRMCACFKEAYHQPSCEVPMAGEAIGGASADCVRTYDKDCGKMIACSRGEPGAPPSCLPGYKNWGIMHTCGKICVSDAECGSDEECSREWGNICVAK